MGALGGSPTGGSVLQGNLALTDEILGLITDNLAEFTALEDISLVGNNKLGFSVGIDAPLTRFIMEVGRRCRVSMSLPYWLSPLGLTCILDTQSIRNSPFEIIPPGRTSFSQ